MLSVLTFSHWENTVALQGTLDTFALPDVLRLLATTQKTGQLLVQGDQGNGSIFMDGGSVVGGETSLANTDEAHEVLFELLRLDDGSFMFDQSATAPNPGAPIDVDTVIEAAQADHEEWQDLSSVVPSLDVAIVLADELPGKDATISQERWRHIVAIGSGTTVRALGEQLDLRELPVLRATRGLVDDGLAIIDDGDMGLDEEDWDDDAPSEDDLSLPSIDDETDIDDLFGDAGDDALPEPLPEGSSVSMSSRDALLADEVADLEALINDLPDDQRIVVERAAEAPTLGEADEILDELPDGAIDRDLMQRFLGSVRA